MVWYSNADMLHAVLPVTVGGVNGAGAFIFSSSSPLPFSPLTKSRAKLENIKKIHETPCVWRNFHGTPFVCDLSVRPPVFFHFFIPLIKIAEGPQRCHPINACINVLMVLKDHLPISPRFTPYEFLSRCKFSTLTTRQPMVEFYLLKFSRFPLRKKTNKLWW